MDMNWTGEELRKEFGGESTVGLILRRLEEWSWSEGQVICTVKLNGQTLTEAQETQAAELPVQEVQTLAISTEPPERLLDSTIQSQLSMLGPMRDSALKTSEGFRYGRLQEANAQLGELMEACRWLTDGLALIKTLAEPRVLETNWTKCESHYRSAMSELVSGVERGDAGLTADVLEYEVSMAMDNWAEVLGHLTRDVKSQPENN